MLYPVEMYVWWCTYVWCSNPPGEETKAETALQQYAVKMGFLAMKMGVNKPKFLCLNNTISQHILNLSRNPIDNWNSQSFSQSVELLQWWRLFDELGNWSKWVWSNPDCIPWKINISDRAVEVATQQGLSSTYHKNLKGHKTGTIPTNLKDLLNAGAGGFKLLRCQNARHSEMLEERRHLKSAFYQLWVLTTAWPVSWKRVTLLTKVEAVSENKL